MIFAVALGLSLFGQNVATDDVSIWEYIAPGEKVERLMLRMNNRKLEPVQVSPKNRWQFEYITSGLARPDSDVNTPFRLRFRIFSQYRAAKNDPSEGIGRMLLRLWDWNIHRMRLEHGEKFGSLVDVYLCFGGKPGGEQLFGSEERSGRPAPVNMIYIYDIKGLTDPLEMVREVAHEYGHATLPAIGGFSTPEEWGNGFLGEQLYLTWILRAIQAKEYSPNEFFGVTLTQIQQYMSKNVDPGIQKTLREGPAWSLITDKDANAMNRFLGYAMTAERVLPVSAFTRAMVLMRTPDTRGYLEALTEAVAELDSWEWNSSNWIDKTVWVPSGKAKVVGGDVLARRNGWTQIAVKKSKLSFSNPD